MDNMISKTGLVIFLILLVGCAKEQNFRGVPSRHWQHLTSEQKQLIVDQSFNEEMKQAEVSD